MNNIPENILQQVADAPFLAGIGEYTDDEIKTAWTGTVLWHGEARSFEDRLRAFLAALPRRESPALAEAIARAEKAESNAAVNYGMLLAARVRAEEAEKEHDALKSFQLGILRPIAEMPETVPDGCFMVFGWQAGGKYWAIGEAKSAFDTHFAILRLPAPEATPPAEPEPAAQVPLVDLEQDDFKPGTWIEFPDGTRGEIDFVHRDRVHVGGLLKERTFTELRKSGCRINTSLPDTGRWDANAWRPCSKPAGKEVAK